MATEIPLVVPALPESVANATVAAWHAAPGQPIRQDDNVVDLETDKVVLEVPSPVDATLLTIRVELGQTVVAGQTLGYLQVNSPDHPSPRFDATEPSPLHPALSPAKVIAPTVPPVSAEVESLPPGARFTAIHGQIDLTAVTGTGRGHAVTKEDLIAYQAQQTPQAMAATPIAARVEERVPLTRMRQRIAERLLCAQQTTALLTTINEINLGPVAAMRHRLKDDFLAQHDVKLGIMSFFVKAVSQALARYPLINASIDATDILYHSFCDISIAIATDKGLVTPVLRNAEQLTFAQIEAQIAAFATQARAGRLPLAALEGGTFTITNGGTYGSLLSTPIINPPQSAILGMHTIKDRPIAENGQVVIAPMMYVALSYDHRLIDGKEAIGFLVDIKKQLENPERMLLNL